jgi:hypothetical protein
MLLKAKLFVIGQDKASKDTFFPIHFIFQSIFKLKNQLLKIEQCHTERGIKKVKKGH